MYVVLLVLGFWQNVFLWIKSLPLLHGWKSLISLTPAPLYKNLPILSSTLWIANKYILLKSIKVSSHKILTSIIILIFNIVYAYRIYKKIFSNICFYFQQWFNARLFYIKSINCYFNFPLSVMIMEIWYLCHTELHLPWISIFSIWNIFVCF